VVIPAPQILIAFRAACAPLIFVLACFGFPGPLLAGVLVAAFLTDVFDGALARRQGAATPALRHADTIVDTIFYATAALALHISVPGAFAASRPLLVVFIIVHVSRTTFELTKYGRIASYHMWSSKALGLLLAVAMGLAFATGRPSLLIGAALWVAIANELEGFVTSAVLPAWRCDVPSLAHALTKRRRAGPTSSRVGGGANERNEDPGFYTRSHEVNEANRQ
jgi:phosphatidylglycerophosphate synthase